MLNITPSTTKGGGMEIKRVEESLEKISELGDYTLYKVSDDDEPTILEITVEEQG